MTELPLIFFVYPCFQLLRNCFVHVYHLQNLFDFRNCQSKLWQHGCPHDAVLFVLAADDFKQLRQVRTNSRMNKLHDWLEQAGKLWLLKQVFQLENSVVCDSGRQLVAKRRSKLGNSFFDALWELSFIAILQNGEETRHDSSLGAPHAA